MDAHALFEDASTAVLGPATAKAGALRGEPMESSLSLYDDGRTDAGIWQCTPGSWTSSKDGVGELMHFVSGHGWITDADGTRHEIVPGAVRYFPDGWSGVWDVDATVRKVYVITRTD